MDKNDKLLTRNSFVSHLLNRRGVSKNVLTKDELDLLSIPIIDDEIITLLLSANEWVYQNH